LFLEQEERMKKLIMVFVGIGIAALVIVGCVTQKFKPGTYTVEGEGFQSIIPISVTVDGTRIIDIQIGENEETAELGGQAIQIITERVIKNQSLAVDGMTGATYTSTGFLEALEKALAEAGGDIAALKSGD
jgi:fumarate reductase flavoprotein subunit